MLCRPVPSRPVPSCRLACYPVNYTILHTAQHALSIPDCSEAYSPVHETVPFACSPVHQTRAACSPTALSSSLLSRQPVSCPKDCLSACSQTHLLAHLSDYPKTSTPVHQATIQHAFPSTTLFVYSRPPTTLTCCLLAVISAITIFAGSMCSLMFAPESES
jgi:hypothetical protein